MCEIKKADISCDSNQAPINESMVDNTAQENDRFDNWKTVVRKENLSWYHKSGNSPDASIKTVAIFVSRLETRYQNCTPKNCFGISFRMQEVCSFKH